TSSHVLLHQHHNKDYTESSFLDSSLMVRDFHRQFFFEDRRKFSFVQPVGSSRALLCRNMSSIPDDLGSKIDAFGNIVEELVSERSVDSMATMDQCNAAIENYSFPGTWWISIVPTASLANVLMLPISMWVARHAWELRSISDLL
ncbi:hypothetical protein CARUB_v10003263mg, partial [Capsella rubella]